MMVQKPKTKKEQKSGLAQHGKYMALVMALIASVGACVFARLAVNSGSWWEYLALILLLYAALHNSIIFVKALRACGPTDKATKA